ncbi:MAG: YggS family pyridoxal phosphate-dependent enzyme [Salinivirgaceae bacterium]|nr:YggS family pyridoxal phosphate-dependent enzyme [Salinivirgaceae bacterium]
MIQTNLKEIQSQIPQNVDLVAVTKTHPIESLQEVYNLGVRDFGESKVQELVAKQPQLPSDIRWHMIGHLQRNKIKYIAPFVHLIHSVDSVKVLNEIQKEAKKNERKITILFEIFIAMEAAKFGFTIEEAAAFFDQKQHLQYPNITFGGLMGMATYTDDKDIIKKEFKSLESLFRKIKESHKTELPDFNNLSMGMSSDFPTAIECGSTMVRVGSSIFGARDYSKK